jgi:crotonobetainyl-CoA:carnitine CoA-transferase CaiB-like acyl-CoA transferase
VSGPLSAQPHDGFDPADAPLAGVRVLDMTRLVPGSLATRRLADLGADVVKIEEPGRGDYSRTIPPLVDGQGVIHHVLNRGKRSVALDMKTPAGMDAVRELTRAADVIVEVSRPGRLAEIGLDLHALRAERPKLVVCRITGFGQTGSLAALPSHGMNTEAYGGCLNSENRDGKPHISSRVAIGIEVGGINAASAILAALFRAERTGVGAELDVSCWDAAVDMQRYDLSLLATDGRMMIQSGDLGPLYDLYRTSDDKLVIFCAIEYKFWENFCRGVQRPDLLPRWSSDGDVDYGTDNTLRHDLEKILRARTRDEWDRFFLDWDVPACPVYDTADLMDQPHFTERQMLRAGKGPMPNLGDPVVWMGECRPGLDAAPAPELGADTDAVLSDWTPR